MATPDPSVSALEVAESIERTRPPDHQSRVRQPVPRSLKRRFKDYGKWSLRQVFEGGQRLGFDILPRHFYSGIPDIRALRREELWKCPRSMEGVAGADPLDQFDFMEGCCSSDVIDRLRLGVHADACEANGEPGYGEPDSEFLFAFIQSIRPTKIVQVGCGVSTAVMLAAASEAAYRPEIVCVEPFPTPFLRASTRRGLITLVDQPAQSVDLDTLTDLDDEGFLVVDSTHAVRPGGEVNRLILEVLPRLRPGSWVHFHDIYFPYDYQRGLLDDELFFSNETPLLHAFLVNNRSYTIRASLSMLHHHDPARLASILPGHRVVASDHGLSATAGGVPPAAIYLQTLDAS